MAREIVRERCPTCGNEGEPRYRWSCDLCGAQVTLIESVGVFKAPMRYPDGWIIVAPPWRPKTTGREADHDFCSWACAARYADQQRAALEVAHG